MAKSKNHTNHNQSKKKIINNAITDLSIFVDKKAHRNGIKKPKRFRHESTLGVSSEYKVPNFLDL